MCGIFALLGDSDTFDGECDRLSARGPESTTRALFSNRVLMVFYRLKINGFDELASQPFIFGSVGVMCNGEIYNHKQLEEAYSIKPQSGSDCEVIVHLYKMFGFEKMIMLLDGEFSIVVHDERTGSTWVGRDRYGVRQLFIGWDNRREDVYPRTVAIASEAKALTFLPRCRQVQGGTLIHIGANNNIVEEKSWYSYNEPIRSHPASDEMIRETFINAVRKRLMSERPIGCLLSGGFDSSIITAVASRLLSISGVKLSTFSIGLAGSPDLIAARKVALWCNTDHHEIIVSEEDALSMIPETVRVLSSYDVTTVRASVWHLMVCRWIRDNTDIKVVLSGEYADEHGSYAYFANAPSPLDYHEESLRLFRDIGYFDNLRSDHCISSCGLEGRIPFADNDFMRLILATEPKYKMFGSNGRVEKELFRRAFDTPSGSEYLPRDVLWRRKNGFSDSVSSVEKSWSSIIKANIPSDVVQGECRTLEEAWYRKLYESFYPGCSGHEVTPYQWLPKWCGDVTDPSARALGALYKAD